MTASPRLLVTGGAGFIGSHIVQQALSRGWEVAALDNLSSGRRENLPAAVPLFEADIRDRAAMFEVFKDFAPDFVSHQAAQASVSHSVKEPYFDAEVNIIGTLNILDAAHEHGVRHIVFASTGGAIYGEVAQGAATESTPPSPISPYATSKLAVEYYLETYRLQYGLHSTVLRYANVYGPRQNPHGEAGVVAIFLARLLNGEAVQVNARQTEGDEGCIRDYVYVADVAKANLAALEGQLPAVVNIASQTATTTRELLTNLAHLLDVEPQTVYAAPRAGDLQRSVLDNSVFRQRLGTPTPLAQGLAETAQAFQSQ